MMKVIKTILETPLTECLICGKNLRKQKTEKGRARQLSGETIYWYDWVKACGNTNCSRYLKLLYAPERLALKLPNAYFTTESILTIESEFKDTKAVNLAKKYDLHLSAVYRLLHQGQTFLSAVRDPEIIRAKIIDEQEGKYYLVIDGTSGKNSNRHLYLNYDALSGELLSNASLKGNTAEDIKPMLKEIERAYGKPAVVSMDWGSSLLKAVKEHWPDVPIQYDHYHFLKNLGKKLFLEESKELKKGIQKIQQSIQRKINSLPEKEKKKSNH